MYMEKAIREFVDKVDWDIPKVSNKPILSK